MSDNLLTIIFNIREGSGTPSPDLQDVRKLLATFTAKELGRALAAIFDRNERLRSPGGRGGNHASALSPEGFALRIEVLLACNSVPEVPSPLIFAGETLETVTQRRIGDCLWQLICRLTELPTQEALAGLRRLALLADGGEARWKAKAVVAASLTGDADLIQRSINEVLVDTRAELLRAEWEFLRTLHPFTLRDWVANECDPDLEMEPDERHAMRVHVLDGLPGYGEFARSVFVRAEERLRAIAEERVPFKSDGAFLLSDCAVIERAALFGLMRGEDWCLEQLGDIWQMASVAPDPKAKTMPSQSLTIRFANATVAEPRPEALRALDAVAKGCRHAGVVKKLERARKSARTALASMPDRLLALDPAEPMPKDMQKPFAAAVEGLLAVPAPILATVWAARLGPGRKEGWALAKALIWEVTPESDQPFTALPTPEGGWVDLAGDQRPFNDTDLVRLWHPADTPDDLSRAWRSKLQLDGVKQPFLQAGREIYRPEEHELSGREVKHFAGHDVSARQLVGLARTAGWRSGFESELHLKLAGTSFRFDAGVRVYHGSEGEGTTGSLWLDGPEVRLGDVPARVLCEAMRKVDLLVSVGERGVR